MNKLEYAELFLTESREHVSAINDALLALERGGVRDGAPNSDAVNAIFRAVHTIKGMAATMGYAVVAELSHELETVLDCVRRETLAIDAGLMDLLFRCADVLEESAEAAVAGRDGEIVAHDLVARLRDLSASPSADAADVGSKPAAPTPSADAGGTLVRVRLAAETPLRGVRAYLIVQALEKLGRITALEPPLEALQGEAFDHDFAARLVTNADAATVEQTIRAAGDVAEVCIGEVDAADQFTETGAWKIAALVAPAVAPPASTRADTRPVRERRHVRIDLHRLDNLMNLVGELVIARGRLTQLAGTLSDSSLDETVTQASRLIGELREEITVSRMVPVREVFDRFPRVVRDAARSVGKQVELTIDGKDIELDRSMLDEIGDSMVHLLRNAVDHGIETPQERTAAGKAPMGRLVLSAARDRSAIVIKVSDDGRGIDRERVLAQARAEGLVDAAKTDLTEEELLRVIARPGFSTAERVTGLSGRGVGLDAVYTRVRALGGAMSVRSAPGEGTTMILRLPLTLAIVRALLARVANETYAIPLAHVSETIELVPDVLRTVKGKEVLLDRDREDVLPLLRLRSLVGLPAYQPASDVDLEHVVVIDLGDRRAGLVIDELTGQEEIVVKQYDAVRDGLSCFGGATLLGDGTPSLIVDVGSLV